MKLKQDGTPDRRTGFHAERLKRRTQNPSCDGAHCRFSTGEVRVLPTSCDSNAILCRECYEHEIRFRKERNRDLGTAHRFLLPTWEKLSKP